MDKNEEINYWISQLKILEDELLVQETMNDRAIVRKDIYNTRLKINEIKPLNDTYKFYSKNLYQSFFEYSFPSNKFSLIS